MDESVILNKQFRSLKEKLMGELLFEEKAKFEVGEMLEDDDVETEDARETVSISS